MKLAMIAAASALALAAGVAHASTTLVVPGTADPFLAGAPAGTTLNYSPDNGSGDADTAGTVSSPAESPTSFNVTGASHVIITATEDSALGDEGHCLNCTSLTPAGDLTDSPVNVDMFTASPTFTQFATSYATALPFNSLVGVFNVTGSTVFEIGDGGTFSVPTGATTLYLGSVDTYQWNNNVGAFDVTLQAIPEPATWAMMVLGLGAIGAGLRMARRKDEAPVAI